MKLKLVKKAQQSDKDPLIVMVQWENDEGKKEKFIEKVNVGAVIEVENDALGYAILSQYRGCFKQVGEDGAEFTPAPKSKKPEVKA